MDPKSTYLLEIKLLGNPKKVRKDVRCFCFDKVVDSDTTNLKDLVDDHRSVSTRLFRSSSCSVL